jgi:hypothetical protein
VDNELDTLINVFTVEPLDHDKLIKTLERAEEQVYRYQSGFISANIHCSLDGVQGRELPTLEKQGGLGKCVPETLKLEDT